MDYSNKIPIAVEQHTKLAFKNNHASTQSFMLLQPMFYRHMLKTEHAQFNFNSVVRPSPIVVPTFGRISHNLRHFFVPYRLVFPKWEDFINDTVAHNYSVSAQVSDSPAFTADSLNDLFTNSTYGFTTVVTSGEDFKIGNTLYRFTTLGKFAYKIFVSLGYDLVGNSKTFKFSALALLAYARVYADWYANSQYLASAPYNQLVQLFEYNTPNGSLVLTSAQLYQIIMFVRPAVYKNNPYFEDCWDNPVSPNNGQFTQLTITDPTFNNINSANVQTLSNGTPYMNQNSPNSNVNIGTQYLHNALKKLDQYQKRHALAGARAIDRVLAEYGIKTENLKIGRSIYVGCTKSDVEISSVFATANGTSSNGQSNVGDYSGAGYGSSNSIVDFATEEEGIFITISTIVPSGGYYQGYDRNNRHIQKSQFFNAAFDTLGVQSIEKGEVYISKDFDNFITSSEDYGGHFGFTGRYGEYKRSIDRVSGDLALPSHLAGGSSWHLFRQFNDLYWNNNIANVSHDEDFSRGTDAGQYNRIFTYTDDYPEIDPFNVFLHTECVSYAPCGPLLDNYDWDTESQRVDVASNGAKIN